ncbi:cyclic nucleotide-binding domain-containing protein [Desulfogranum mediterraneum]|uniref:cyclic nucleotide-binding domain-containing protein n=1 Tax=Desulfogranum mediterraneum TaxID=160661 RepID=UPI000404AB4D|nr:cyclic nucleotide-binding domain-containing protein [Desulfogranum mediterraneum]
MSSPKHTDNPSGPGHCRIQEALAQLQQLPLFRETPLEILKLYAYLCTQEHYGPGESILCQGQAAERMYLITAGSVTICTEHQGKHYLVQQLSATELNYFGELALLAKFEWFFSAWADSEVTLLSMSREAFQKVLERFPHIYSKAVEKIVTLRIDRLVDQTHQLLDRPNQNPLEECPHGQR